MNKLKLPKKIQNRNLVFFTLIFGAVGALLLGLTFAGTNPNPTGFADYCTLEGNNTVIYGWGHDDDAPSGAAPSVTIRLGAGASVTVPTDRSGYYDSLINQYLSNQGYTTSDTYGFRAQFSGIYKGSSPTIDGTVLNYGDGTDDILHINTSGNVAPYSNFSGGKVPDACLANAPVPVLPQPTPSSVPKPVPKPAPRPAPRPPQQPASASPPSISSEANATATVGTFVANLVVPTGNANIISINYGTTEGSLSSSSAEAIPDGDNAMLSLTGLQPKTLYYYQINRLNTDKTTTSVSPTKTFNTVGYDLIITPRDQSMPLTQLEMNISPLNTKITSDESGQAVIKDVLGGAYSLSFTYNNNVYKKDFVVNADSSELVDKTTTGVAVFKLPISLAELTTSTTRRSSEPKNKFNPLILLLIPLGVLLLGAVLWWIIRRRSTKSTDLDLSYPVSATPEALPPAPEQITTPELPQQNYPAQTSANSNHIGESLKDMVIKSIQEQNAKDAASKSKEP